MASTILPVRSRLFSLWSAISASSAVYGITPRLVLNLIKKEDFGYRQIRDIRVSDAKQWMLKLHEDGKGYSTLTSVRGVVKPAFQMAYNEDVLRRNPFDFKLTDVVPNDSRRRVAMTPEQQDI